MRAAHQDGQVAASGGAAPEVILQNARQHEHLHVNSLEDIAAAGHAGTECPGGQLRHRQIGAVTVVVPYNDGAGLTRPAVDDVAGAGVGLKP